MTSEKSKESTKFAQTKTNVMKHKEDQLRDCIITLKTNPRFIRLLTFSLASLDGFVTPPNNEIKINAKIIIRLDGVLVLKTTTTININNEDIVLKAGEILWKLISMDEIVDHELAKKFSDKGGHDAVIEILLCKQKGPASKPYVKILNGLSQIPHLVQRLIDSGVIEACKLVNDIYIDNSEIITINFETMKKISNLKSGREFLLQKNLVPNLLKNLNISAKQDNANAVIAGLGVLDNLSRDEAGKQSLKKNNTIEEIAIISDLLDKHDKVLQMCGKVLSKIANAEDMIKELKNLENIFTKQDYSDLKPIDKSLILVSNFMLVEDIGNLLNSEENTNLLTNLFEDIKNIDLVDKSKDFFKNYLKLNKDFMVVFNKMCNNNKELHKNEKLMKAVNFAVIKNFEALKNVIKDDNSDETKHFIKIYSDFFSSFGEVYCNLFADTNPEIANIIKLLKIINEGQVFLRLDEKFNNSSSKIMKLANRFEDAEINQLLYNLIDYMKEVLNISENSNTLENILEVLYSLIIKFPDRLETISNKILKQILNFMIQNPKYRKPNLTNLKILDIISLNQFYIDSLKLTETIDFIKPIIYVLTMHQYSSSTVLKVVNLMESSQSNNEKYQEDIETNINLIGLKLLERFVNLDELKIRLKFFKEIANSFNPTNFTNEQISLLENSLLFFLPILKIKSFFPVCLSEVLDGIKTLIKKEVAFIETFKKEKNNEKNSKFHEIVESSSRRLKLELGILKTIDDNCCKNYLEAASEDQRIPNAFLIRDISNIVCEFFDKSNDISNLSDLICHLHKNVDFILENEHSLNANPQLVKSSSSKLGIDKKFDAVKFEDSILEKEINTLINLLRRNISEEGLSEKIISAFITLAKKKNETCNLLVKAGCPRLLLQIIENTSNSKLVAKALELIKYIILSSPENLEMVSNQDILDKLNDTFSRFPNDHTIINLSNTIINELVKLPGLEKTISDIIKQNMKDITDIVDAGKYENEKPQILFNLERINAFTSNRKQIALMIESNFVKTLNQLLNTTLKDQDTSNLNENLINNEFGLLTKIIDEIKVNNSQYLEDIINNILKVIKEKSHYRDLFLKSLKSLSGFINNNEVFEKILKNKLDTNFIDQLFDIQENYLDDCEVSKEINNIFCNLCLKSEKLAAQIIKRGGLANVMEELKSSLKINDEFSDNLKYNCLKFIHSICNDKNNLETFLAAKGADLIQNIIKYELKNIEPNKKKVSQYITYDIYNFSSITNTEENNNPKIVECFKIINIIIKNNSTTLEANLISNMIELIDKNYPNKYLFRKGMKILSKLKNQITEIDLNALKDLIQTILSYNSFFISDTKIYNYSQDNISNIKFQDDRLMEILRFFGTNNKEKDPELSSVFEKFDNVILFLCYFGLYTEFDINNFKNKVNFKEYSEFIDVLINKIGPIINNEGGIFAMIKILHNYLSFNPESKNHLITNNSKFNEVLLKAGMNFYKPANYTFINQFLRDLQKIFDSVGNMINEGKFTEGYLNFLENIYLRSFEVFDLYELLLNGEDPIDQKFIETIKIVKNYVLLYLKQEGNDSFIKSSIKKLSKQCDTLLKHPKIDSKDKALPFWEILYYIQLRDVDNFIIMNEELIKSLLNNIFESIPKFDDEIIRKNFEELAKKIEMDRDLIDKICIFINDDLDKNISCSNNTEIDKVRSDLITLNNIIKYPITSIVILKNNALTTKIFDLYEKESKDPLITLALTNIIKKLTENSTNINQIIQSNHELLSNLLLNLQNKQSEDTDVDKEILNNELAAFTNLVCDNYNYLINKKVFTENNLKFVCGLHSDHPIYGLKLKAIIDAINSNNQEEEAQLRFDKDKEIIKMLNDSIANLHKKHLNEIEPSSIKKGKQSIFRLSKASIKPSIEQSGSNSNFPKLKSPLSCKDNPDSLNKLDQILAMIFKLNNEFSKEKDHKILTEKGLMILSLLYSLKLLSIIPDNHQPILEMGLLKFMEKISEEKYRSNKIYIICLEISNNCTNSENAIIPFISSSVSSKIIEEVLELYNNIETITSNPDIKSIFLNSNEIFSNLCKSTQGFEFLFNKIGLENLLNISKLTTNTDILSAVLETLVNFVQNNNDVSEYISDILTILAKCLAIPNKSSKFISFCYLLAGLIYCEDLREFIQPLGLVNSMNKEFDSYVSSVEFINSVIFCLGRISENNNVNSKEAMSGGILHKIQSILNKYISNETLTENITSLYGSLIRNNLENLIEFCKNDLSISIFTILENYLDSNSSQIIMNCILCLDQISMIDQGIIYLSKTKFQQVLLDTFEKKSTDPEIIKNCLHCLGNYLYKDLGNNVKTINFEKIILLLILLQKKYYSNSDILININYIAGYLIKLIKDKVAKDKLYQLIEESIKIQDWNIPLIIMALKLINEILVSNSVIIDDIFEETMHTILNLLKNHHEPAIIILCYMILNLFAKNYIFSYVMVKNGLIEQIKGTLESEFDNKTKFHLRDILIKIMNSLSTDINNAKKLSEILINKLILDFMDDEYANQHNDIQKLIYNITKHKTCIEPFVQYNGIDAIIAHLKKSFHNVSAIYECFNILGNIIDGNDDYKKMLLQKKAPDLINEIIIKSSMLDKRIEYEGRNLIFSLNSCQIKLEKVDDLSFKDIKVQNPIKPEVKNFVVSGKIIKFYSSNGDKKKLHLSMNPDLNKISCKKPGKNLPPKPKYVIETNQIKRIIQGYGTKSFEKHTGLFKKPPPPEKCFSIIGPTTVDGEKSFNIECETPEEAHKWMEYLEIVGTLFKKNLQVKKNK